MRENLGVSEEPRDAGLWLTAIAVSLCLNAAIVLALAFMVLRELALKPKEEVVAAAERFLQIEPVFVEEAEEEPVMPVRPETRPFVRTSPEQQGEAPDESPFIGEHDTVAGSPKPPVEGGPEHLPNQDGVEPVFDELETTESDYQDGDLGHDTPADPVAAVESDPAPPMPEVEESERIDGEPAETPDAGAVADADVIEEKAAGGEDERLAEGPLPVDRPVPMEETEEEPRETDGDGDAGEVAEVPAEEVEQQPNPPAVNTPEQRPGFRGNQQRTLLRGSISRSSDPALDVESGPLGKYHAQISRAIEKAWQRQVVKNRDYITPGVIRVRVVLDPEGKVRSVGTVEEFGIGAIQKGFTHAAIREAEMPVMPAEVKEDLQGETLELLYNFIF